MIKHTYEGKNGLVTKEITRGQAIRAKCMECCNFQTQEVRNCENTTCALWPFRMYHVSRRWG